MSEVKRFWSVTTLLKMGMGLSEAIQYSAVEKTATYALENATALLALDREMAMRTLMQVRFVKSDAAKARGTDLHKAAEALALGAPIPSTIDFSTVQPFIDQYQRFLDEHQPEFLMAEAPIYSPKYFYAGTLDGIMLLDGQRVVFDIKTTAVRPGELTKGGKPKSRPPFNETALQLVAYRRAELVGTLSEKREIQGGRYYEYNPDAHHEPMPETDGAVCIVVSPEDYMIIPVRTDDEVFRCFIAARECARFSVDVSKRVFGPPITKRPDLKLVEGA